jgi:hypothetical protein
MHEENWGQDSHSVNSRIEVRCVVTEPECFDRAILLIHMVWNELDRFKNINLLGYTESWDSPAGAATGCGLDGRFSIPSKGKRFFSCPQSRLRPTQKYYKSRLMRSPCCLYVYLPLIVARQRLGKHFPAATNTYATTEELLEASFSIRSVSYQRKEGDYFFPELLVYLYLRLYRGAVGRVGAREQHLLTAAAAADTAIAACSGSRLACKGRTSPEASRIECLKAATAACY